MSTRTVKSYKVLVGLEIHVQLATQTKMFTGAPNGATNFGAEPNTLVDEVILGLPGVLPVMNKKAVEYSMMVGLALGCEIAKHTKWDRKSYYYPDLPKNYQISQYDLPLCGSGTFEIATEDGARTIRIRRAHLEEDAGKLLHEAPGGYPIDWSIVDLNRAGTPLLEIVTEPDFVGDDFIKVAKQVSLFAQELQKLVQYLDVSGGQMQMGHLRFEPNINVHITDSAGQVHKTAITEVKNLNSFGVLERSVWYEARRQVHQWEDTGSLGKKSTYGWDDVNGRTVHQRDKEEAHDYRYFPDPDLCPVTVDDAWRSEIESLVGELPQQRLKRYVRTYQLSLEDAQNLTRDRAVGDLFEMSVAINNTPKRIANLIINALGQLANKCGERIADLGIEPARIASVAGAIDAGKAAAGDAVTIFEQTGNQHIDVDSLEKRLIEIGLRKISDSNAIDSAIDAAIAANPKAVADYKSGKEAAIKSLMGNVMKSAKGLKADVVLDRLKQKLS